MCTQLTQCVHRVAFDSYLSFLLKAFFSPPHTFMGMVRSAHFLTLSYSSQESLVRNIMVNNALCNS